MKKFVKLFLSFLVFFTTFAQKGKSNYFDTKILNATTQSWVAGIQGDGMGVLFNIEFKEKLPENIVLEQLFFNNAKAKINFSKGFIYSSNFVGTGNKREEQPLEYDSQTKPIVVKPPFPVKENQAVLEYSFKNLKRYFIISNVKQIPSLEYPQARPSYN